MWDKWEAFWQGRVSLSAWGEKLAQFLTEAWRDRIVFYHTSRSVRGLRAKVSPEDFKRLRRAARLTHTRVRITSKKGLPFALRRWQRRKGLLAGFIIIVLSIAISSQLVLFITVSGVQTIDAGEIRQEAAVLGLERGVWHGELDLNEIARNLQEKIPEAAWIGIQRTGTRVEIKVVEKKRPQVPSETGNLVAAKAGLVQDIMVIQGVPLVHEGEIVRKGQALIRPAPKYVDNKNESSSQPDLVARGFVRGRVWYSDEQEVLLVEDKTVESGSVAHGWGIKIGSRVIMVTTPNSPYEKVNTDVQVHSASAWRNWRFPVEIITITYYELETIHVERSGPEARALAEEQARAAVRGKITPGAKVVEETVKVMPSAAGTERVRIEVETYEDLAVYANP